LVIDHGQVPPSPSGGGGAPESVPVRIGPLDAPGRTVSEELVPAPLPEAPEVAPLPASRLNPLPAPDPEQAIARTPARNEGTRTLCFIDAPDGEASEMLSR
jgi:hypothetical protein